MPATLAKPEVAAAGANQTKQAAAAAGLYGGSGTDLTGSQGLKPASTAPATLLGG